MGLSRQEYWSGLPFPPPGDLPNPGIKPTSTESPALQAYPLPLSHWGIIILLLLLLFDISETQFSHLQYEDNKNDLIRLLEGQLSRWH